jgi:hypothetical protein
LEDQRAGKLRSRNFIAQKPYCRMVSKWVAALEERRQWPLGQRVHALTKQSSAHQQLRSHCKLMNTKIKLSITTLAVILGVTLALVQNARTSAAQGPPTRLEGAWIMKFVGVPQTTLFTLSPTDSAGRRAVVHANNVENYPQALGFVPEAVSQSVTIGEAAMISKHEGMFTVVQYGLDANQQIVWAMVDSGTFREIGPDKMEHYHNIGLYLPHQLGEDGLPIGGEAPFVCVPVTSIDTRISLRAPCTPTPMP